MEALTLHHHTETQRTQKQAIAALESKSSSHAQTLEKEQQETAEMHDAIASLTQQKEQHLARRDSLRAAVATIQSDIKQRREAQSRHRRSLDAQARHNAPELHFWEAGLGMRIEAAGAVDAVRVVFALDESGGRECWFDLVMGGSQFEVAATKPKLDRDEVDVLVERLNEARELGPFLQRMRALFLGLGKALR